MGISPVYTIHQYREDLFKVIAFKGRRDPDAVWLRHGDDCQKNENKLASNFSRARSMVLQYALCNPWEYFFTGTLDAQKMDRYNLDTYAAQLMQFIRDKRKKYDAKFQVLLVPEKHQDGAWHIHGLIHGLPDSAVTPFAPPAPRHLIEGGFLNWPDYMNKFGFCSLAPIRDPIATAYYVTKYIGKDMSQRSGDLGKHLYFHSRPLKKAECASDVYYWNPHLDDFCTEDHIFCKTGMVGNAPWYFPYQWDGVDVRNLDYLPQDLTQLEPVGEREKLLDFDPGSVDPLYEQVSIADWCNGSTAGSEPADVGSNPASATSR